MKRARSGHGSGRARAKQAGRLEPNALFPVMRSVKPRDYGSTKAVVTAAFAEAGGAKRLCAFFDLGLSTVYGFTDPDAKGCDLSLDRARRLTFLEGVHAFADDFAALAGGVFLTPDIAHQGEMLADIGGDLAKVVAEVVAEILKATQDGNLDVDERRELRRRTDGAIAVLVALRGRVMDGSVS